MKKNNLIVLIGIFLLSSNYHAHGQSTNFVKYKRGYINIDIINNYVHLDTIRTDVKYNIDAKIIFYNNYIIGIDGCGQIYINEKNTNERLTHPLYPNKTCMGIENSDSCIIFHNDKMIFISKKDWYFRKEKLFIIEIDLKKRSYKELGSGRKINCINYSDDYKNIKYVRDDLNIILKTD